MKRTLIAAAVLAVSSGSVFAHALKDPFIFNSTVVNENVGIWGGVLLFGCVNVSNTTGAVVNNSQTVNLDGVTLRPNDPTGAYLTGHTTTYTYDTKHSVDAGGTASGSVTTTSFHASGGAQGFQESSGYAYANQKSSVAGGGYEYSQQHAAVGGYFYDVNQSQGGHISAGGHAGGSYSYNNYGNKYFGGGSAHVQGGFSAGYNASSWAKGSGIGGNFEASEGSGQGVAWGFSKNEGSGYQAFGEQSSGYSVGGSIDSHTFQANWNVKSHDNTTNETTVGAVTTHYNGVPTGSLDANIGGTTSAPTTGISGNVGINITEGVDNAQSNDASLAMIDAGNVFGNAQIFNNQSTSGNAKIKNFNINASVGSNALANASGNVGVNVAAGVGNAQNNSLAVSSSTEKSAPSSAAMVATDESTQSAGMDFSGKFSGTASMAANALAGASGNIGVNIAGGAGNVQHNGLAIAAVTVSK
ncbi:hypothetical protein [Paraburkholderia dinghuensis]|uniref:Cell wall anchor protein n=1 Tax=Paraburkholderia dinghuensis TaxID=2305225 RepID=A0A3N6N0I4_9BURK|nr:hypothetical protein [Paraburkholderia dinghuensis]RQH09684.1 hypothetical protein D1Y85_00565 [Paraburkholderia dinghuensis]